MGSKQRLVYTDPQGDLQVLAERRGSLGKAQRIIHKRRGVGYDWAKLHGSNQLFDSIPVGASNFQQASNGQNEPEIFLQDYQQGSWVDFARIYAEKGAEIQEDGKTIVKFYGFDKYIGSREVSVSSSQDIVDVMEKALPAGYVLDYPTDVTHPSVTNYSNEGKLNAVFQDMWDKYNYAIDVRHETDSNGNYKVRFEPVGYGGAVDDIKTAEGDVMRRWNNNDTGKIVNKVTVIGKDSSGAKVEEVVTDQASIDEYGEKVHPQNPIHVDYRITSSEAQSIGQGYIEPDPVSHGRARSNLYESNVFNDSVQVVDPQLGISDTFTITAQKTYFDDDTATELDLDFEQEGLERKARGDESLWSERAKLYPSETKNVGQQSFTGDTGSAPSDTNATGQVNDNQSDTNVTGDIDQDPSDTSVTGAVGREGSFAGSSVSASGGGFPTSTSTWYNVTGVSGMPTDAFVHFIEVTITGLNNASDYSFLIEIENGTETIHMISVENIGQGGSPADGDAWKRTIPIINGAFGYSDEYYWNILAKSEAADIDYHFAAYYEYHEHGDTFDTSDNNHAHGDSFDTDDNNHGHGDTIDTNDNSHGGSGDASGQHGASGQTDGKDINVPDEVNVNRE